MLGSWDLPVPLVALTHVLQGVGLSPPLPVSARGAPRKPPKGNAHGRR